MTASLLEPLRRHGLSLGLLVVPAGASALAAVGLSLGPTRLVTFALAGLLALGFLVIWPWAALPVAVVGGAFLTEVMELDRVQEVVVARSAIFVVGVLAVTMRRIADPSFPQRVHTRADLPMLLFAIVVLAYSVLGLACGNDPYLVLVAGYELLLVPAYYLLATLTVGSASQLRQFVYLLVAGSALVTMIGFGEGGRHGGFLSAVAALAALAASTWASSLVRWLLVALSGLFVADVFLSGFRHLWVAFLVAFLFLLARGGRAFRRLAFAGALLLVAGGITLGTVGKLEETLGGRLAAVDDALQSDAGYRWPEARYGFDVVAANPLWGGAVGQTRENLDVATLGIADVGPVYHAFWVTIGANTGLLGLGLITWALAAASRRRARTLTHDIFRALLVGFAVAATFAGPRDGHWELGLFAGIAAISGLVMLERRSL